ncbi:MAG: hypothetical protein ACFBRM_06875 [Pikeienuella sp.]
MELVADGLLIATALAAALYCLVLSRRLRRLTDAEAGIGGQIAALNAALEETKAGLAETRRGVAEARAGLRNAHDSLAGDLAAAEAARGALSEAVAEAQAARLALGAAAAPAPAASESPTQRPVTDATPPDEAEDLPDLADPWEPTDALGAATPLDPAPGPAPGPAPLKVERMSL